MVAKLANFVTTGNFEEALLNKAAKVHQHAPTDLTDPVPIEKGGTGANTAQDAVANLGITTKVYLHNCPLWQSGMSTYDFINAMPANTFITLSANGNYETFSDAPTSFGTYIFSKGVNNNYILGVCVSAADLTPEMWAYSASVNSAAGAWGRVLTAANFSYSNGTLSITI